MKPALSSTSFALFFLLTTNLLSQQQLKPSSYADGESWQFRLRTWDAPGYDSARLVNGIYEIVYSQNQLKSYYHGPSGKEEIAPLRREFMWLLGRGRDFHFPLAVGEKWSYPWVLRVSHPSEGGYGGTAFIQRIADIHVSGIENITTEAGSFKAFRLVKEDRPRTSWVSWVTVYYFSPQTRSVVKSFLDASAEAGVGLKREIILMKHGIASAEGQN